MPAHLGVASTYGLSAPAGGYVQESSREDSVEIATIRDESGITVKAVPKPMVTRTVNLKGKGDANLAAVAAGSFAAGVLRVTEAKQSESNEDFPDFEITGTAYLNLSAS